MHVFVGYTIVRTIGYSVEAENKSEGEARVRKLVDELLENEESYQQNEKVIDDTEALFSISGLPPYQQILNIPKTVHFEAKNVTFSVSERPDGLSITIYQGDDRVALLKLISDGGDIMINGFDKALREFLLAKVATIARS